VSDKIVAAVLDVLEARLWRVRNQVEDALLDPTAVQPLVEIRKATDDALKQAAWLRQALLPQPPSEPK